jgi:hypothetical protein
MPQNNNDLELRILNVTTAEEQKYTKERNLRRVRDKHRFDGNKPIKTIVKHGRNNPRGFTLGRVTKLADIEMYEDE